MAHPGANEQWPACLRAATLRVPDPRAEALHYASLFDAEVAGDAAVMLGSGTRLQLVEGEPGFESMGLDVSRLGHDEEVVDPDGRRASLSAGAAVAEIDGRAIRLGHVTFQSPDPVRAQRYWEGLGFRLSEGLREEFRWLRCNPIHHTLAFARAPRPSLHHVGIELPDRGAFVTVCDRLSTLGQRLEYGPGRHMVGGNLFAYFLDRNGIRFELFCELERIEPFDREPVVHELGPSESVNLWGPPPPESFRHGR